MNVIFDLWGVVVSKATLCGYSPPWSQILKAFSAWCERTRIYIYMEFILSPKTFRIHSQALFKITRFPATCIILISISTEDVKRNRLDSAWLGIFSNIMTFCERKYAQAYQWFVLLRYAVFVTGFSDPCTYLHYQYVDCSICGTSLHFVNVIRLVLSRTLLRTFTKSKNYTTRQND